MEAPRPKVIAKVTVGRSGSGSAFRQGPPSRPASPIKRTTSPFKHLIEAGPSRRSPSPIPMARPRAKVSSSAVNNGRRVSVTSSRQTSANVTTARMDKSPSIRSISPSRSMARTAASTVKARITVRPPSNPSTPERKTSVGTAFAPSSAERPRTASVSMSRTFSSTSLRPTHTPHSPSASSISSFLRNDTLLSTHASPTIPQSPSGSSSGSGRIKAKVSSIAKSLGRSAPPPNALDTSDNARADTLKGDSPLISPVGSASSSRRISSTGSNITLGKRNIPSNLDAGSSNIRRRSVQIDPTNGFTPLGFPAALHSPPTSALSVSSTSSFTGSRDALRSPPLNLNGYIAKNLFPSNSRSPSQEVWSTQSPPLSESGAHFESVEAAQDADSDGEEDGNAAEGRAKAKSNRKLADLEITNKSLLAINITLEAAKHRQAKELRDLRRKLRESRLILPPSTYQAVKSTIDPNEEEEAVDDDEDEEIEEDETYRRIKSLIEGLLDTGRKAIEVALPDPAGLRSGTRVLSAYDLGHHSTSMDTTFGPEHSVDDIEVANSTSLPVTPAPSRLLLPPGDAQSDDNPVNTAQVEHMAFLLGTS